ncbi:hypothetical protein B0O79_1468 [Flavobacteriaceae bacterium MAR_2009_75]|nr:hypothetical protein B0O79_1468 [Flavobacteriaceae bacterium MAR_2009_75]
MKLYRQEKLIDKLLKFRWKKHNFDCIKVECYNRFDGDNFMCRVEVFRDKKRLMKHEAELNENFVRNAEDRLGEILIDQI